MRGRSRVALLMWMGAAACGTGLEPVEEAGSSREALLPAENKQGVGETAHASGAIDRNNPFFANLGTNGRTCETCHAAEAAWTTSVRLNKRLWEETQGTHPMFVSLHDSGNRPDADVSTLEKKKAAFSTVLEHGVTRFTRSIPATADFTVVAVDDPYGWATPASFSSFRRPGTNMGFVSKMVSSTTTGTPTPTVRDQLISLMNGATLFHAQTTVPVSTENRILGGDFMNGLAFAQLVDDEAGRLDADGAKGGPTHLLAEPAGVTGPFDLFSAWENAESDGTLPNKVAKKRAQIARGQNLFNTRTFSVSGVAGLNDSLGIPVLQTTCNGCHRSKNVGGSTSVRFMDIGVADASNRPDWLPLLTVKNKSTGEERQVTDLGRAVNTRLWSDIGKVRVLGLRGLAARAPYFHAGQAKSVKDVIDFYDERFDINFTSQERKDLEAFLLAL